MVDCTSPSLEANTKLARSCEAGPDGALTLQQLAASSNPAQRFANTNWAQVVKLPIWVESLTRLIQGAPPH
jgi:hypothetical protein